jgi:hypothetical protein
MIVKKITHGFVIQYFDTASHRFLKQEFVAGDIVEIEDANNEPITLEDADYFNEDVDPEALQTSYLPFDMVQPENPAT